jgi:hypothetical protein
MTRTVADQMVETLATAGVERIIATMQSRATTFSNFNDAQFEQSHLWLREASVPPPPTASFGQMDIGAVIKASQAISGEIVLSRLSKP